ncbi:MAG: EAL domain-containing protein [Giesbergeria sp.]
MHSLLLRQIRRLFGEVQELPARMLPLFEAIDAYYHQADNDREMIERSLDIASQEMLEQNRVLTSELEARRAAESRVVTLSNFDTLTGLANRSLFVDRLNQAIASALRQSHKVVVVVLGLDYFKLVNESLGYSTGNELLKIVGDRLRGCVRGSDIVARLGGDEFALIFTESVPGQRDVHPPHHRRNANDEVEPGTAELLQRIMKTVSSSLMLADRELEVTCSMGVSLYPRDGTNSEALLKAASVALSNAKRIGSNNFQFFTVDLSAKIQARLVLQGQLRLAVEREEFVLHYQPQVDLCSGRIVGVEALIRWNHPELGLVPPGQFIGLAEETGLIVPIGAWVIRTACAQSKAWERQGLGSFRMAVNVSVRQFAQPDLAEYIAAVLAETGLEPHSLEIELTESLLMQDVDRSIDILQQLKAIGLQMSIDDFGTGYSSLAYLKRFPIDLLKIDQAFVRDIETSLDDTAIVKAIISMAHSLGLRVIAEGVETEAQCNFLRLNMCDEIQGYFFSRPVDAARIGDLLAKDQRLAAHLLRFKRTKRSLLLVDDDPGVAHALQRLLRRENLEILIADGGQAGLEILAQQPVDVIISDQRMPGMTGVEFLKIAKDRYPETIRIVLSGDSEMRSVTEAVNDGAIYKFLSKPWSDPQLCDCIEEAFLHKEMADDNRQLQMEILATNQKLAAANRKLEKRHAR